MHVNAAGLFCIKLVLMHEIFYKYLDKKGRLIPDEAGLVQGCFSKATLHVSC